MSTGQKEKVYDLEERTALFSEAIIVFCKKVPKTIVTNPLINQLVKSATSVGANYCEADCAESRKDFEHKIGICKKEAKESRYWLRLFMTTVLELKEEATPLWKEARELQLIFIAIANNSRKNGLIAKPIAAA